MSGEVAVESASTTPTPSSSAQRGRGFISRGRSSRSSNNNNNTNGGSGRPSRSRSRSQIRMPRVAGSKLRGVVKSLRRAASGRLSSTGSVGGSNNKKKRDGEAAGDSSGSIVTTSDSNNGGSPHRSSSSNLVQLGEMSTSADLLRNTTQKGSTTTPAALELAVLLMDPLSRRFELLQLEFDSHRAKVSDLIAQIPLSVTEDVLKTQSYVGVMDENGTVQEGSIRLLEAYGKGPEGGTTTTTTTTSKLVLVAKPMGISVKETMRLAKPILSDKDVAAMLTSAGFDVKGWKAASSKAKSNRYVDGRDIPDEERVVVGGAVVSTTSTESDPSMTNTNEEKVYNSTAAKTLLWLAVFVVCFSLVHKLLMRPIGINEVLPPGTFKAKCGLLGYVIPPVVRTGIKDVLWDPIMGSSADDDGLTPSFLQPCQPEYLLVSSDGSRVTITDANGDVTFLMDGHVCPPTTANQSSSSSSCVDGLVMTDQKTLMMGGKPVRFATVLYTKDRKKESLLSPWPFVEEPIKLKIKSTKRPIVLD